MLRFPGLGRSGKGHSRLGLQSQPKEEIFSECINKKLSLFQRVKKNK